MSLILNIETSTQICSVSVANKGEIIDFIELNEANVHASKLAPSIHNLLSKNNFKYKDLKAIGLSEGPGSYTGLRIGSSLAKGLCFALQIPLIAVNTLQSIAIQAKNILPANFNGQIQPMIDARRMEVYTQKFDSQANPLNSIEAIILTPDYFSEDLKHNIIAFCGDGARKYSNIEMHPNIIFLNQIEASAKGMSNLSYNLFLKQEFANLAYFEPLYFKEFAAAISKVKGLD